MACFIISNVFYNVWRVLQCMACFTMRGMFYNVWCVLQCVVCFTMYGMFTMCGVFYNVWCVLQCMVCFTMCGMFYNVLQGPSWDGRSGVHTHMTNTRITDPEILERRYTLVCCLSKSLGMPRAVYRNYP